MLSTKVAFHSSLGRQIDLQLTLVLIDIVLVVGSAANTCHPACQAIHVQAVARAEMQTVEALRLSKVTGLLWIE